MGEIKCVDIGDENSPIEIIVQPLMKANQAKNEKRV